MVGLFSLNQSFDQRPEKAGLDSRKGSQIETIGMCGDSCRKLGRQSVSVCYGKRLASIPTGIDFALNSEIQRKGRV
jgi:hypothetical protein